MTARVLPLAIVLALTTGCASIPTAPSGPDGELISYETETGPFCGRCDTVKIVARSDGLVWIEQGYWAGSYADWRTARRYPRVSREAFARFRARLAPFRPAAGERALIEEPACETLWTDMGGLVVHWRGGGDDAVLRYNYGCDPEKNEAMLEALRRAPAELGIRDLHIPGNDWVATTPT